MNSLQHITQKKYFKATVIITFFTLSAIIWLSVRIYHRYYLTTDDAYINANVVQIAPRVTGKIVMLYVTNNQFVQKGQPLFDLDPAPFQIAVDSAKAQVMMAEAQLGKSSNTANRTMPLVQQKYLSPQDGDNAVATLKSSKGNLDYAKAGLGQALLNLEYTNVVAPISGWITNLTLHSGDIVTINQPLFALISNETFWADVNFKETEMSGVKPGQTATIVTDLYPGHRFSGVVESISGGAGSAFSLLPPQNATGNWVKVTQRVPVRVRILNPDVRHQLRIGISATVTVNLKQPLQMKADAK